LPGIDLWGQRPTTDRVPAEAFLQQINVIVIGVSIEDSRDSEKLIEVNLIKEEEYILRLKVSNLTNS
jgi:hypothetical protein